MRHHRTLITMACLALLTNAHAQNTPCPGEPLIFQVEGENHGTKTWEHSTDGVTWNTVDVVENEAFILQPEQSGWYRVRFHDEECDISYVSEAQHFIRPAIELGDALTLTIGGVVYNEFGNPLSGANVRAGCDSGVSTTTDHFGVFLLEGVAAYEGLAYVTVEKGGYFKGSRSFVPGDSAGDAISQAYITLLQRSLAGTVQSTSGGQVTREGVNITFPANGFVRNGLPYTGVVNVYLNHIDPTSEELHTQMPGMLMGIMDDEPQLMLSYGMVAVELTNNIGQPVHLAAGSQATLSFPVLAAQQNTAPTTIPLWWFDEDLGYWIQEGEAQRVGNRYVGQVTHFSWWNCDVPSSFVELDGLVSDSFNGAGIAGARIIVVTQTMGSGVAYSDGKGEFTGLVPLGQQLTIQVQLPCSPNGNWSTVHTEIAGPYMQPSSIAIQVSVPNNMVTGLIVDCDGLPVDAGYVMVNGATHFCADGVFKVFACAPSITLRGVDPATGNVSAYSTIEFVADTIDIGELSACLSMFDQLTDIEGNSYQTVLIGDQEWMAQGLRTATYANGDPIPNVTDNMAWTQLASGASCSYSNNSGYDGTYGKLYNWYAAANPNLCPQGWHLPSDAEWQQLELVLGMPAIWLNAVAGRGTAENVGGKMKALTNWNTPNTGATNESGFSGRAGGRRDFTGFGEFSYIGSFGFWWSASDNGAELAWSRDLYYNSGPIGRSSMNKRSGFHVRCVRD